MGGKNTLAAVNALWLVPLKLCISLSRDGLIKAVGPAEAINLQYSGAAFDKVIDAKGMCVLPGEYLFISFYLG